MSIRFVFQNLSTGTVSVTRKSASESNLQALAAQPLPSSATSGLSSSDYISADTPANGVCTIETFIQVLS